MAEAMFECGDCGQIVPSVDTVTHNGRIEILCPECLVSFGAWEAGVKAAQDEYLYGRRAFACDPDESCGAGAGS